MARDGDIRYVAGFPGASVYSIWDSINIEYRCSWSIGGCLIGILFFAFTRHALELAGRQTC